MKTAATELKGSQAIDRIVRKNRAGDLRGGLALTEPDCGSDLQAIRTEARRTATGVPTRCPP